MAEDTPSSEPAAPPQVVSATEWPTDPTAYSLTGKIGQGAFATVYKANCRENTDRVAAIKVLNLDHVDSNLSEIRLEVQAMRLSSHPNILVCHAAFCHQTDLWLVTQLMRKGSSLHCLQGARRQLRGQKVSMEQHIFYIMHETLLGLQYIHDNGQIHRDIKAGNILLDGNGDVRIADFGVSGWLVNAGSQQEKAKTFVGTPCWMAPEVMEQVHGYDYKADIWSLGITALELAKGYAPYAKYPPMKVLILTIQEDPPSLDSYDDDDDDIPGDDHYIEEFSKSFRQFVDTCLQKDPAKRPKSLELLQSKYLNAMQDPAQRRARREAMCTEVCDLIADVGGLPRGNSNFDQAGLAGQPSSSPNNVDLPGNTPVSIILSTAEDRPAGTTWVFADGSQVLASQSAADTSVDEVLQELDNFGLETGGEHYNRPAGEEPGGSGTRTPPIANTEDSGDQGSGSGGDEPDDLNAFMDEFEMHTQGEDFRRG